MDKSYFHKSAFIVTARILETSKIIQMFNN